MFFYCALVATTLLAATACGASSGNQNESEGPLKGEFQFASDDGYTIYADLNLYEKTIDGYPRIFWDEEKLTYAVNDSDTPIKVYGFIESRIPGIVDGFYVINVDSMDSPEPNIWIFGDKWGESESPVRVGYYYNAENETLTLFDWEGGIYFNNATLKKK